LTLAVFDVSGRLAETGSGNKSPLVAFKTKSTPLEQLGDMLIFCKGLRLLFYGTAFFPLTLALFDLWGRLTETRSRNQSPLVALESARLEQLVDTLTFCKGLKVLFYGTACFFPLTLAVFNVWCRLAETGSGNKLPLVAFESTPLEQPPACCTVVLDC